MLPPVYFDPYADARPAGTCPVCGAALYEGERVFFWRGTDHAAACERCAEARQIEDTWLARE